jgi:hypothetical protein
MEIFTSKRIYAIKGIIIFSDSLPIYLHFLVLEDIAKQISTFLLGLVNKLSGHFLFTYTVNIVAVVEIL